MEPHIGNTNNITFVRVCVYCLSFKMSQPGVEGLMCLKDNTRIQLMMMMIGLARLHGKLLSNALLTHHSENIETVVQTEIVPF